MQYHTFSFPYNELFPEPQRLYEIISNYGDDGTLPLVEEEYEMVKKENHPGSVAEGSFFITNDFIVNSDDCSFTALNKKFNPGKNIMKQIRRSSSIAFFICTAGYSISNYADECMNSGNPLRSYIADLAGSLMVEKCMDRGERVLTEMLYEKDLKITNRFSPGYCGWNTLEQHKLFEKFPSGFCGVSLTESALMLPIKSISGIIGIGKDVKRKEYNCSYCNDLECFYRKG